jgi:hypothetical protein
MPQIMVKPYMSGKMVDRNHGVKPRFYRRPNRPRPESSKFAVTWVSNWRS